MNLSLKNTGKKKEIIECALCLTQHKIINIPNRRGPFLESILYYEDLTPIEKKETTTDKKVNLKFVERVGRPTKLERRQTDKLMGRN